MAVYTKTDKRFRRAHVRPSKKRRSGKFSRQIFLFIGAIALFSTVAYWTPRLLERTSFLKIDTISIDGNRYLSNGEVLALVGELRGQNILLGDLEGYRNLILTSGWVKDATLRRLLPSTIEVVVKERRPIGIGRFFNRLYLIDELGNVLDEHGPVFSDLDLPIIDGLSTGTDQDIEVDLARARLAVRLIADLESKPKLSERVSQINVDDSYNAVVLLSDDQTLIHLGAERFVQRLMSYIELAPALHARVANIDYVDLRFENRIYVRPAITKNNSYSQALLTSNIGEENMVAIQ
jgi:cell division protein FtsQ